MLAPPECGLNVSCPMNANLGSTEVDSQPQMTGVLSPHPPCSNPGLGTTFVDARAVGTATSTSAVNGIRRIVIGPEAAASVVDKTYAIGALTACIASCARRGD